MQPRFENFPGKKLAGKKIRMSFASNKVKELWQNFIPLKKQLKNTVGIELYSLEIFDSSFFREFDPQAEFEKWAAVELAHYEDLPVGLEKLEVPAGLYAVFLHKGPASKGPETYGYIYRTWLPASAYVVDERPHFAVMGEKYSNDSENSEEEIWIPIKFR